MNALTNKLILGFTAFIAVVALTVSLVSFQPEDPELSFRVNDKVIEYKVGEGDWKPLMVTNDLDIEVETSNGLESLVLNDNNQLVATYLDGTIEVVGSIPNEASSGISEIALNDDGELIVTLGDDSTVNLGVIKGADGTDGEDGDDGEDGVSVSGASFNANNELVVTLSNGEEFNLGVVVGQDGINGVNPEIRVDGGFIQWQLDGDTTWTNIIALADLEGDTGDQGPQGESTYELYQRIYPGYTDSETDWLNEFVLGDLAIEISFQYEENGQNVLQTVNTFKGVSSSTILANFGLEDNNDPSVVPTYFLEAGLYQVTINSPISELQFYSALEFEFERVVIGENPTLLIKEEATDNTHFSYELYKPTSSVSRQAFFALAATNAYELQAMALYLDEDVVLLNDIVLPNAFDLATEFTSLDPNLKALMEEIATVYGLTLDANDPDDLTFERLNFIPIGRYDSSGVNDDPFVGSVFGNQKVVSNLEMITQTDETAPGLFAIVAGQNIMENLELKNLNITQNDNDTFSGGLIALSLSETITLSGISLSGNITSISSAKGPGSLIGRGDGVTTSSLIAISDVNSLVNISATGDAGGLIGYTFAYNVDISNVDYAGSITSSGTTVSFVGGLVGGQESSGSTPQFLNISGSSFTGTLKNESTTNTGSALGGLVGIVFDSALNVNNSSVSGTVESIENTGGLVGSIVNSNATIKGATNNATITGADSVGGLIGTVSGTNSSVDFDNTTNAGDVSGNDKVGGLVGENVDSTISSTGSTGTSGNLQGNSNVGKTVGDGNAPTGPVDTSGSQLTRIITSGDHADLKSILEDPDIDAYLFPSELELTGILELENPELIELENFTISGAGFVFKGGDTTLSNGSIDVQGNAVTVEGTSNAAINISSTGVVTLSSIDLDFDLTAGIGVYVDSGTVNLENTTLTGIGQGLVITGSGTFGNITGSHFEIEGPAIVITNSTITREDIDALLTNNTFGTDVTDRVIVNGEAYNQTLEEISLSIVLDGTASDETVYLSAGINGVKSENYSILNDYISDANNNLNTKSDVEVVVGILNRLNDGLATSNDFADPFVNYFGLNNSAWTSEIIEAFNDEVESETTYYDLDGLKTIALSLDTEIPGEITITLGTPVGKSMSATWNLVSDNFTKDADISYTVTIQKTSAPSTDVYTETGNSLNNVTVTLESSTEYTLTIKATDLAGNKRQITSEPFTTGAELYAGGDGTSNDPYLISSWAHLDNVRLNLDAHYKLTQTLDNSTADWSTYNDTTNGNGWVPIGRVSSTTVNPFTGSFDGNEFSILDFKLNPTENYTGLFAQIEGANAIIQDLTLDIEFNVKSGQGNFSNLGGITGLLKSGTIQNVTITGVINLDNNINFTESRNVDSVGLIAGELSDNASVLNSSVTGDITMNRSGSSQYYGLVAGKMVSSTINIVTVSGNIDHVREIGEFTHVGLVVGYALNGSRIEQAHVNGSIKASHFLGGIVGYMGNFNSPIVSEIFQSSANITITSLREGVSGASNDASVGGIAGVLEWSNIYETYAIVDITAKNSNLGGIAGRTYGNSSSTKIIDYYVIGSITGIGDKQTNNIGGVVGLGEWATLQNGYVMVNVKNSNSQNTRTINLGIGSFNGSEVFPRELYIITDYSSLIRNDNQIDITISSNYAAGAGSPDYNIGIANIIKTSTELKAFDLTKDLNFGSGNNWSIDPDSFPYLTWQGSAQDFNKPGYFGSSD